MVSDGLLARIMQQNLEGLPLVDGMLSTGVYSSVSAR